MFCFSGVAQSKKNFPTEHRINCDDELQRSVELTICLTIAVQKQPVVELDILQVYIQLPANEKTANSRILLN